MRLQLNTVLPSSGKEGEIMQDKTFFSILSVTFVSSHFEKKIYTLLILSLTLTHRRQIFVHVVKKCSNVMLIIAEMLLVLTK